MQNARLYRVVGRDHARTLWHHRRQAAAVPLRRPGKLARADRTAAGKQRRAHLDRNAGSDAVEKRARACGPASGMERSTWAATPMGSAVVAAHAADSRL